MHKIRNITVDPSSTPLLPITILDLDMSNPRWRTEAAGTPTKMAYYSHTQFVVTPAPGNGVGPLNVEGYIVPSSEVGGVALLANANDEPEFGPQFHTILAYFAVRELAGYDLLSDNPAFQAKAQECDGKYNSMIAAMMDYYATGVGVQARKPMGG
jgi:hypothetical protein